MKWDSKMEKGKGMNLFFFFFTVLSGFDCL